MKNLFFVFVSLFSILAFAESFEELKAHADAYQNSPQGIEAKHREEVSERLKWIPRGNRLVISRVHQFAGYNFGGVVGKIGTECSQDGAILKVDFLTRKGYRCKSQRFISELLCINTKTLEKVEGLMSVAD